MKHVDTTGEGTRSRGNNISNGNESNGERVRRDPHPSPELSRRSPVGVRNNGNDHEHDVEIVQEEQRDTSTPIPQPMYESLDDVVNNREEYRELPLPESVDPEVSFASEWPPSPALTKTRHNLVEIPSTSTTPSPPNSVIMMRIDEEVELEEEEARRYPPPPANFM